MKTVLKIGLAISFSVSAALVNAIAPDKSPNDDRIYDAYTLRNKLQVLLVSDPGSTKAAAALDVNVGSGADPIDRQGLAHFLEHMLFLGTEKYPTSGEYQEFISAHGGSHNAYTSFDHTNYFFDIDAQYLEPALDRFAQFFAAPLFNAEFVGREINAVESEYRAKLKEDSRRSLDVFKSIVNQDHPFAKLSVGNVQTLLNDASLSPAEVQKGGPKFEAPFAALRGELLSFYDKHYAADKMTLVVVGPQSTKQLKRMVADRFAAIPAGQRRSKPAANVPLFAPEFLPRKVLIQPEADTRSLSVTFPIPKIRRHYRSKPDQYLGNIIGHEGQGSLLSYLKGQGWAEALSAGAGLEHESEATFNVSVSLTEAGLRHQTEIVSALFQLIDTIRTTGVERWRQREQETILSTAFRYQEQGRAIGYASQLASKMHDYPVRDVLKGAYRLSAYKPGLIKELLDHLRPANALITVMAPGLQHELKSPWYDTPYTVQNASAESLASWSNSPSDGNVQLPLANPFVSKNIAIQSREEAPASVVPVQIASADGNDSIELWWTPEPRFEVPRSQLFFNIRSTLAGGTARNAAMSQLLAATVADALNEYSYPALLAGINFQVRRHMQGLSIRVGGYSDKQGLLLEKIAEVLSLDSVDEQRVLDLHNELLRRWGNDKKRLPYQQLFSALNQTLVNDVWSPEEQAAALPSVNAADLREYGKHFLNASTIQAMAVGNVSKQQAIERAAIISAAVSCSDADVCVNKPSEVLRLQQGRTAAQSLAIDHGDSALIHYFQANDQSAASRAKMAMTAQLLKADYFQQLRTQQQLGYIVFATTLPLLDVPGFALIVQSPGNSVGQINDANSEFLKGLKPIFDTAESASYPQHKAALLSELREKPKNLAEQGEFYWSDLALGYQAFSRRSDLITAVESLSFDEWRSFFDSGLANALMIWSEGGRALGSKTLEQQLLEDPAPDLSVGPFIVGDNNK